MLKQIARKFRWAAERYVPDALVLTVILTLITFALGLIFMRQTPVQMVEHWYGGFWNFLSFGMQMALILATGYCLAMAPQVQAGLSRLAEIPRSAAGAVTLTALISAAACYISWGFGLVLGPILAREMAKRVEVDYPLLVAASYCSAICALTAGLTITAPITVNTPGHFLEGQTGLIPLTETIFSPTLLFSSIVGVLVVIWAFRQMLPEREDAIIIDRAELEKLDAAQDAAAPTATTVSEKLNQSKALNYAIVIAGMSWLLIWFWRSGLDLNLNILNFAFLMIGLGLHGSLGRYAETFANGVKGASGIILQFPFYAGIMGMMAGSGLVLAIAQGMASIAEPWSFGFISMLSAGLINIFVPSAGGQWAIQGPVLVEAAKQLQVPVSVAVNGFTIGDLWTNFLQPFFALPALGISGLGLKDIWGYCLVVLVLFGIIGSIATLVIPRLFF